MSDRHRNPAHYREIAETLRRMASRLRFDLCRRAQLLALAAGFERFADRIEREHARPKAAD